VHQKPISRRGALKSLAAVAAAAGTSNLVKAQAAAPSREELRIDPTPTFELSPYLYMQFMEPLGATDGSVEAGWDHLKERWRPDLIETTRELGPTLMRWGGIYTDYYRWREGVGPRAKRPPMLNLLWGGIESNQVGTGEFVDFCRQVGADALMCVNFESDGRERYMKVHDNVRTAGVEEAAEWVAYCNEPVHAERAANGSPEPYNIPLWQIGNETSYDRQGFPLDKAATKTVEFAKAMRKVDPSIKLIGWGDSGWAPRMAEVAGEHLDYLAFHHMFNPDDRRRPVLERNEYRKDPARTWDQLMKAWKLNDDKIREVRDSMKGVDIPLAMTECHFAIPGRDRCDVSSTWAAGVSYARILNNHQRHGDVLKIATAADFCGTRWQVNAVMIPVPENEGRSYMMPVARAMSLYRHHIGTHATKVDATPDGLDVVASVKGDKLFVHAVNTERTKDIAASLAIPGRKITGGTVHQIASRPMNEITHYNANDIAPVAREMKGNLTEWTFPAASVSALELDLEPLNA
jgi:alpha-N-arabinofuranosidase